MRELLEGATRWQMANFEVANNRNQKLDCSISNTLYDWK